MNEDILSETRVQIRITNKISGTALILQFFILKSTFILSLMTITRTLNEFDIWPLNKQMSSPEMWVKR